ncbi:CaiB/BaiF CoA transferase family protein [Oceanibacterium hippocampi]|uniref:E-cinnamoyl-CoA:R-phenyllactate CoA transferase n=1 Tax=Oceanibacterium hippocampi TaxID=745714 RepID=A0A1Y5TMN0_9PROT|nr:CoA transferase [Oceanibacterium hippocampi]SLN67171.1 E-cinnamoyl-CoA:R-phenyllactate CoA transferase [Oceanibacterium hippocampi]
MAGTLEGLRVVDLSTVILGPWASQMLGDMGADVIKVESPAGDTTRYSGPRRNSGMASLFLATNRNKRSIVLDLTKDAGREALFRIAGSADVLLHNFRPKAAKKLGLDYEAFAEANPELIFCATYGFGSGGPLANTPAYDDIIQAASGIAELQTITAGEPRYVPTIVADKTTAHYVVSAILAALLHRERHGGGQAIEVPMFESLVDYVMVEHLYGAAFDPPIDQMGYARLLNTARKPYRTKDGYLAVLPYTDQNWRDFLTIAGRGELIDDPRFADLATRVRHSQEIYGLLADMVATRTTGEWQEALGTANIPVMVVNSKEMLLENEQLDATGFWRFEEHPTEGRLRMTNPPVRFSRTPSSVRTLPPHLGEHSAEILGEAGYSAEEIETLLASGVTRQA